MAPPGGGEECAVLSTACTGALFFFFKLHRAIHSLDGLNMYVCVWSGVIIITKTSECHKACCVILLEGGNGINLR